MVMFKNHITKKVSNTCCKIKNHLMLWCKKFTKSNVEQKRKEEKHKQQQLALKKVYFP